MAPQPQPHAPRPLDAPLAASQVGFGLVRLPLPFAVVCARCGAHTPRADVLDASRRRLRAAEGHDVWSYSAALPCCTQAVELRADTRYLTYTVVSGGAAERATDEEAIFEELRDLTTRWAVAATEASHSHRTVPTFASAPSPGALAGLAPDSHHYAPSSSARSRSGSTASGSTSARTLLGGRPGARQARIAAATAAAHAETTSSAQLRRIFAHERARRELPGGAPPLTTSRMLGASAAFRSREGVGIGGSDGRGGGTTRLAPPPRPSAAPAPPQPRNRTSVPLPRALEELARPTTRERAAQHLGESAGASALARRLGQRARKQADPFEREMRESVERGRALRTRGAS